jgi:gamma-glutamyltranspeptidase/glutathione hydrolase/leukotriene-C4 hydrolase
MFSFKRENEKFSVIDARETAPELSAFDMFDTNSIATGGLSIAVPGEIKGYWKAHELFGKLKWNKLFQPAIEMCFNGYCLPHSQHKYLKMYERRTQNNESWKETFINELKNEIYKANTLMRRPKLGKVFEKIAREGESAFYDGILTDTILNEVKINGGIITKADLNNYQALVKDPVTYKLKNGTEIGSVPPPSCGILLNFMLSLLDCKYLMIAG